MSRQSYDLTVDYGAIAAGLADDTASAELVRRARREAVGAALPYLQRQLALATPSGATGLARSHVVAEFLVGPEPVGRVGWAEPAASYIAFANDGTRPHWPPRAPMEFYAARKFGYPVGSADARRAGYLVARKISRFGTPRQAFFERTVAASRPRAQALMRSAALAVLRQEG